MRSIILAFIVMGICLFNKSYAQSTYYESYGYVIDMGEDLVFLPSKDTSNNLINVYGAQSFALGTSSGGLPLELFLSVGDSQNVNYFDNINRMYDSYIVHYFFAKVKLKIFSYSTLEKHNLSTCAYTLNEKGKERTLLCYYCPNYIEDIVPLNPLYKVVLRERFIKRRMDVPISLQ